ncbi:SDR family NAD(P)-dependent oxidoreductase [Gordonia rhizosphera]|uniref:Putative oxidoreductase n=1 Tax=Gordonia rhizosphera NBRC 16068 TaxID=1108045 RepID=K6X1H7_9ACTN|nr:SDR family NAD(P)-dependent oxidoreductase [Gordonia rhizosphera]GAB92659.1 putative oxidoreductase [Gordonia rhizosphera NBRC 16068]
MADQQFKDRYGPWAAVAGASTGLGAAFADELAQRGLNVVLVARRGALMEETAEKIRAKHGVEVKPVVLDLADSDADAQFASAVEGLEIGFFIYNAALEPQGLFVDEDRDSLIGNIVVNCITPTLLVKQLAPGMIERKRGGIVLVSSLGALQGIKVFAAYGAAKSYELILGEGLWDEFREHGVDACTLVVGATSTPVFLERQKQMKQPSKEDMEAVFGSGGVTEPFTPEQVAASLFPQLGTGPRVFANPDDEKAAEFMASMPRADTVAMMGKISSMFWE